MEKEKLKLTGILEERFQHYDEVLENGCNDPLWADGVNLNLIRNYKCQSKNVQICSLKNVQFYN